MKRASFKLGSVTVNCFEPEQGKYLYSLTDLAAVLNKGESTARKWIQSKTFKALPGGSFKPGKHKEGNVNYSLVPNWVAMAFITHNAVKNGDKLAGEVLMALAMESLDIRAMVALNPESATPAVTQRQELTDEFLATRERQSARYDHMLYQRACYQLGFHPRHTHEYITQVVFGYTASEARQLPDTGYSDEIWQDLDIGINHHKCPTLMKVYRDVKKCFLRYKSGTMEERVNRAYLEVTENLLLG